MTDRLDTLKQRWLFFSIAGLLLTGTGLCLFGEALWHKFNTSSSWEWILWGTISLVVFNTGLCLFGQGVIERIHYTKAKLEDEAKD